MVLGIVAAVVFVFVSAVFFTEKLGKDSPIRRLFSIIHKPLGYLLVALAAVHIALVLPLIRQRPVIVYILGAAMTVCAIAAITTWYRTKDKRRAFLWHKLCAFGMAPLLIAHMVFCITGLNEYVREVAAISFSDPQISAVADGEYTGECNVGYIYAKVRITVRDGTITKIDLLEHRNERGKAGEGVIDEILCEQHTNVDAVSGATNSSKVIKKAVENALEKGING